METSEFVSRYLDEVKRLCDAIEPQEVTALVDVLLAAWQKGSTVLFMGNGGSAASVSHIVNDMQKNLALEAGKPLRAMCLSDNTPLLMAWANDTHWDNIFAPQMECWVEAGDVVIGVSGSGNSMNIINGIVAANNAGAKTFGMAGMGGGKLKATAHHCIVVPSDNMQRIEDLHMILLHLAFSSLLDRAK